MGFLLSLGSIRRRRRKCNRRATCLPLAAERDVCRLRLTHWQSAKPQAAEIRHHGPTSTTTNASAASPRSPSWTRNPNTWRPAGVLPSSRSVTACRWVARPNLDIPGLIRCESAPFQRHSQPLFARQRIFDNQGSLDQRTGLGLLHQGLDVNAARIPVMPMLAGHAHRVGGNGADLAPLHAPAKSSALNSKGPPCSASTHCGAAPAPSERWRHKAAANCGSGPSSRHCR